MAAGYNGFSATQANPAMSGSNYSQADLILYANVAASILGVESEHRALIRSLGTANIANPTFAGTNLIPANNLNYEIDASLTGLIVGVGGTSTTAATALGSFLSSSPAFSAGFSFGTANSSYNSVITAGVTTSVTIPNPE